MRMNQSTLLATLDQSVVELVFRRRRPKDNWPGFRRMLCSNDRMILNSPPGHLALHFRPPTHPPAYDWRSKNLVCAWDLFWQDYRMISVESCDVVSILPTRPPEQFWTYFNTFLQNMTPGAKEAFMKK